MEHNEMEQNLLHWIFFRQVFFVSFVKSLNMSLDEYSLFLSQVKELSVTMIASEQERLW